MTNDEKRKLVHLSYAPKVQKKEANLKVETKVEVPTNEPNKNEKQKQDNSKNRGE